VAEQQLDPAIELVWTYDPSKPSVRNSLRG
jgi:hypothetical protein